MAVGAVYVEVKPSTRGFVRDMQKDLLDGADKIGKELGEKLGKGIGEGIGKSISDELGKSVGDAGRKAGDKAGKDFGGAFARSVRTSLDKALSDLSKVEIDADVDLSEAEAELQRLRAQLAGIRDLHIEAELDTDQLLRGIATIEADLIALRDSTDDIPVRFNTARAIADLAEIKAAAVAAGEEIGGGLKDSIDRNVGGFATKVREELRKASETLPDIPINADTSPALRQVYDLRTRLAALSASIDIDTDIGAVLDELATLEVAIKAIDSDDIDINVDLDLGSVLAQLAALRAAAAAASDDIDVMGDAGERAGEKIFTHLSHGRLIMAAIITLLPLIAGAFLALPAAIAAVAAPIAAVAAGVDGLKSAFSALGPELDSLQSAVSATFVEGMAPAVENISALMPTLQAGLVGTAAALSQMTTGVTEMLASADGLSTLESSFDSINTAIADATPVVSLFTQNLLTLINAGAGQLPGFVVQLEQVGVAFRDMLQHLSDMGTLQAAIEATFQVLSALVGLIGPLTEFGAVLMQAFGPALATAIQALGAGLSAFAHVIDSLPGPISTLAAILVTLGLAVKLFNIDMATAQTRVAGVGNAIKTNLSAGALAAASAGIRGIGTAFQSLTTFLANNWLFLAITAVVTALSLLGQANADAAAEEAAHKASIQELTAALNESGGAINAHVIQLAAAKLESSGMADNIKKLGFDLNTVAATIAAGGPTYDALVQKLTQIKEAGGNGAGVLPAAWREAGKAAGDLLPKVEELRAQFVEAQAAQQAYAQALASTGTSMVAGLANADALQQAMTTLGDSMSSTSDKANALKQALDALNGGQLTADEAAAALMQTIDDLGKKFEEAQAATTKAGTSLVMANGAIDNTTKAGRDLSAEASKLRDNMIQSATAAFQAAGGLGNVESASAAASAEVQKSRDAFIAAAREAGLTATQAEALANRYQLIPSLVTTLLRAENLPQVQQEISQLSAQINAVPPGKTVHVEVLSEQAFQLLDSLGVDIQRLPDGSVDILANDQTKGVISAVLMFIAQQNGQLPVGADGKPLMDQLPTLKALVEGNGAKMPIEGQNNVQPGVASATSTVNSSKADLPIIGKNDVAAGLQSAQQAISGSKAELPITGRNDVQPGVAAAQQTVQGSKAELPITGRNDVAAGVAAAQQTVQGSQAQLPITGNNQVQAGLDAAKAQVEGTTATMHINAESKGADDILAAMKGRVEQTTAIMKIDADTGLADTKLGDFVRKVESTTAILKIDADTSAASAKFDALAAPRTTTLTVNIVQNGTLPNAVGNLVPAGFSMFANGGMAKKMRANHASIVPPRTYRMIGDRARDDEAYIPINQSARSKALLAITANRMGYGLAPLAMAAGGLVDSTASIAELLRRQRLLGSRSFSTLSSQPTASGAVGLLGGNPKEVEGRLDSMISLLQKTADRPPAQITVEDKSGDPVATGRATYLAMRLAR